MFENIKSYYEYLENDNGLLNNHNISKEIASLRDKSNTTELKSECSYEIFFTDYSITKAKITPHIRYANGDEYPNLSLFDDDLKYIQSRAKDIKNPKYKAKYNNLLWNSKHKHLNYAKQSIDSYIDFITSILFPLSDNLSNKAFEIYFENLFILSQSINYRKDEVLNFLISILKTDNVNGYSKYSLMKFIVVDGKRIGISILQSFYDFSNTIIIDNVYTDFNQEYLELLILLCPKLNISPKSDHNKLADFYIMESEKQEESFVIHDFYIKALREYQKSGNKNKVEEITVLIEKVKKNISFKAIKIEHTDEKVQEWWNWLNKFTDNLIEKFESKDIYQFIIHSDKIFPKSKLLTENIQPTMFSYINVMTFDINKNIGDKKANVINAYFIYVQNFTMQYLLQIFIKGIKKGNVSYETLISYLQDNSWYGKISNGTNSEGEKENFNWMELLAPSLFSFFTQSEVDIKTGKNNNEAYILAIDSLVIKFEGLLREFSKNIGAQTIEIKDNGTQERISFEKLLDNQKVVDVIPEDDIALFKFLFTSDGMNLRNNIAHSFYKTNNYSAGLMLLLTAALLRLGNYKFEGI
ncbi:MAG TPA: DUF4209 domain-containing protein [Ferruginibacter sp.]|nr:DUF4209 domain-containing protein [Ferruginibacter sp.]